MRPRFLERPRSLYLCNSPLDRLVRLLQSLLRRNN